MGNTDPAGERHRILEKLRVNTSILDFSAASKETCRNPPRRNRPDSLYSAGPERVSQPRRGVARASRAESALYTRPSAKGRGFYGAGIARGDLALAVGEGSVVRAGQAGAGLAPDLWTLASGACRDTWCGTGAVSGCPQGLPSREGAGRPGWNRCRAQRCLSLPGLLGSAGPRGIRVGAVEPGSSPISNAVSPGLSRPRPRSRARDSSDLSPGPRPLRSQGLVRIDRSPEARGHVAHAVRPGAPMGCLSQPSCVATGGWRVAGSKGWAVLTSTLGECCLACLGCKGSGQGPAGPVSRMDPQERSLPLPTCWCD